MNQIRTLLASVVLGGLVASCGSSSSGGGGGAPAGSTPGGSTLDSTNATAVAAAAIEASTLALDLAEFAGEQGTGGLLSGGPGNVAQAKTGLSSTQGTTEPINGPLPCENDGSGEATGSITFRDSPTDPDFAGLEDNAFILPGSSITTNFVDCALEGVTIDGLLSMTFVSLLIDPDVLQNPAAALDFFEWLAVDFVFTNLRITEPDGTSSLAGDLGIDIDFTKAPVGSFTANGVQVALTEPDGTTTTLQNYAVTDTFNDVTADFSTTSTGTVTSGDFGGPYVYTTELAFSGNDFLNSSDPTAGRLLIEAGDGSSALISVINNGSNVEIKVDADGDGIYEGTEVLTWGELYDRVDNA
jgi:hypothetical protein